MTQSGFETAVIIGVEEAGCLIDDWRARTTNAVPAHVTLLVPFVPPARLDDDVLATVSTVMAAAEPFHFLLGELRRFPGTLYLAPQPSAPFVRLTTSLMAAFPGLLPYGGAHAAIVPHVTVAQGVDAVLERAAAAIRPALPIRCHARQAMVIEQLQPIWRRWRVRLRTRLGA